MEDKPLIVQSNFKILLEINAPSSSKARDTISDFLELQKSPRLFHTYELNKVSLWNGFSKGITDKQIIAILTDFSKFPLSKNILQFISQAYNQYGMLTLHPYNATHQLLKSRDPDILPLLIKKIKSVPTEDLKSVENGIIIKLEQIGVVKHELTALGYPIRDLAGYFDGEPIDIQMEEKKGHFKLRKYQQDAIDSFFSDPFTFEKNNPSTSPKKDKSFFQAGLLVLPCGAGKTVVGLGIICRLKQSSLIVTPNTISLLQWKRELLDKTSIKEDEIGEYTGKTKEVKKITLATYQQLTYRKNKKEEYEHLKLFNQYDWGLIVYDEVHMLPADTFRFITGIQTRRRLGLTATMVREDHKEIQVYSLIGPKKYDLPWKQLENEDFLAKVSCYEIKIGMSDDMIHNYFDVESEAIRYRLAAENPAKITVLKKLLKIFKKKQVMVIGQYLNQLDQVAEELKMPLITGKTKYSVRQEIYQAFNAGELPSILVSKIANFAIDLPNAEVAIQISGTYGSRQEEAQRLGRIIRPKINGDNRAYFFSLITDYSRETLLAQNRKGFLIEQGYHYDLLKENHFEGTHMAELEKKIFS